MFKKVLKVILKLIVGIFILSGLAGLSFYGWEYVSGGKYVDYLSNNSETIGINEQFSYELMGKDLENSKLIMVGEMHGFKEPTKFDVHFFKHLYDNFGVRHYISELDYSQAKLMNIYLETGNDSLLQRVLKRWIVAQGKNNKDYFLKYKAFHEFYQQLDADDKFEFIGVDRVQDWPLFTDYVNILTENDSLAKPLKYNPATIMIHLKQRIKYLLTNEKLTKDQVFELKYLYANIIRKEEKLNREEMMFLNFKDLFQEYDLFDNKLYAYFGVAHVFQYQINGHETLASYIRESDLGFENKILSMNFLFVDSDMVMNSKKLPEFLRTGEKYSKMTISADNIWFMYIYGVGDFKRVTDENQKSIYKMNADNNPYANTSRLTKTFRVFPLFPTFEMTEKGKPYIQYTIFVRNSEWAEPFEN